jgi:hypothetical protein
VVVQDQAAKVAVLQDLVTQQPAVDTVVVVKKADNQADQAAVVVMVTAAVEVVAALADKEIAERQELASPDKDVGVEAVVAQHNQDLDQTFGQILQDQVAMADNG